MTKTLCSSIKWTWYIQ